MQTAEPKKTPHKCSKDVDSFRRDVSLTGTKEGRKEQEEKEERISAARNDKLLAASPLSRPSMRAHPDEEGATKWIMGGGKIGGSR